MTSRFGTASFGASANGNARGYGAPNAQAQRSKEAPMDYQWTNRSSAKPAWATGGAGGDGDTSMGDESPSVGLSTPRKRTFRIGLLGPLSGNLSLPLHIPGSAYFHSLIIPPPLALYSLWDII